MMGRLRHELRRKRGGLYFLFFFCVLLPMLTVFPYIRDVNNPNEFVRVFTVMALVESKTYRVDEQVNTWGHLNDLAMTRTKDDNKDHYFMVKAPAILYAGVPGYWVFSKVVAPLLGKKYPGVWGGKSTPDLRAQLSSTVTPEERLWWLRMATWAMRLSASQIPCFLFLLWFERYLRAFSDDIAIRFAAVAAMGLGTNYLAYAHMFASHSQYAMAAFIAFATIEKEWRLSRGDVKAMRHSQAMLAGFCTSLCVALEYHALFLTVVMSTYAFFVFFRPFSALLWLVRLKRFIPLGTSATPTRLLAFAFGGLANVPHVMYFHWSAYGNAFTPGHQKLESAQFAAEHKMGLWGILWPSWEHIRALAVDPSFGFFGMSPFMWIGLLGILRIVLFAYGPPSQRTRLRWVTIVWFACMTMVFGVNAGFVEWRAGWTVGPRYLCVCGPFFAFGAVCALEQFSQRSRARRALARGLAGGLALAGVVAIGAVSITFDTLPENITRPFSQFTVPLARAGLVPHHVGEWFDWSTPTLWYIALGGLLLAPCIAALAPPGNERRSETVLRVVMFVAAAGAGLVPVFLPPTAYASMSLASPQSAAAPIEAEPIFEIRNPTVVWLATVMEPHGRDRITHLRQEAERHGTRGIGPCLWLRAATLERTVGQIDRAAIDEAKAKGLVPKDRCLKNWL